MRNITNLTKNLTTNIQILGLGLFTMFSPKVGELYIKLFSCEWVKRKNNCIVQIWFNDWGMDYTLSVLFFGKNVLHLNWTTKRKKRKRKEMTKNWLKNLLEQTSNQE